MKKNRMLILFFLLGFLCLFTLPVHAEEPEENEIAIRLEKAKELGLEEWVDEEGYLIDEFYEEKTEQDLTDMGVGILVRKISQEEVDAYVANLNAGISAYEVSYVRIVWQVHEPTGKEYYTGYFEVDGILAFCIERNKYIPIKGTPTSDWIPITNDDLRKVLYYGYNGPENKGYTYVETALAAGEANGTGNNPIGEEVLAEIKEFAAPPKNFKVWKVETDEDSQDLAFYTIEEESETGYQLPNTGATGNLYMSLLGIFCCVAAVQKTRSIPVIQ